MSQHHNKRTCSFSSTDAKFGGSEIHSYSYGVTLLAPDNNAESDNSFGQFNNITVIIYIYQSLQFLD
jgi:hypothetical protein